MSAPIDPANTSTSADGVALGVDVWNVLASIKEQQ
jgi:hypothetical protein